MLKIEKQMPTFEQLRNIIIEKNWWFVFKKIGKTYRELVNSQPNGVQIPDERGSVQSFCLPSFQHQPDVAGFAKSQGRPQL